jgi:hypothetical protein
MWESSGGLYYAFQQPNGTWSDPPVRVAAGLSPSMILDAKGELNVLFANQFMGNYEIYHIRRKGSTWSLPVNVSHTSGTSGNPVLALASNGTLNATWVDSTPGYSTLYHGSWNGTFWSSQPVPNGRGQGPSLAASPAGALYLAWQDKVPTSANPTGEFDVLVSEFSDGHWSIPVNVSNSPAIASQGVSVTATQDGTAHTSWVDESTVIKYRYGRDIYWSQPQAVASTSSSAHAPRIIAEAGDYLSIAWDQSEEIWTARASNKPRAWSKPVLVAAPVGSIRGVTIALRPVSGVTIGWTQAINPGGYGLYASWQAPALGKRAWLPIVTY